jgi:hypothetical protein
MIFEIFTSEEVFSGEINENHCFNSDPKRSH